MSIQDDAFDIEKACKCVCPEACRPFMSWAYELEQERDLLLTEVNKLKSCIKVLMKIKEENNNANKI